tara:strand:+ start:20771 stop:26248 length:5478 start_codon:yes stop_codon:yes gene_type:complete
MSENKNPIPTPGSAHQALENLRMRLLDLTSRNRLINFKHSKSASLRVIDELPNQLVETLLAEQEMRFVAIPEPTEKELIEAGYLRIEEETGEIVRLKNPATAEEWAKRLGFETSYEVPEHDDSDTSGKHTDTAIQTLLYPYEMEARLKGLLQSSESAIQEMGANILYLAFGFLEWFESKESDSPRHAPLFLMPVRLNKGRLNPETRTYIYTLNYSGEDIIPNLSLREKLRIDFGLALPDLDETTQPEAYFKDVQALVEDNKQDRWRVRRQISLALLNFSKLLMYLDLDPVRWPDDAGILEHPVVARFLSGTDADGENASSDVGFGEEHLIDEMDNVHTRYPLIDDADSSQHSALIDAVNGKNLVIEGPPGTGKSQTITNLIAAAMAQGKRVLFVAEKLAALEVVRSRLDRAGLGTFCLELHSHKTQKRRVLDEIDARLRQKGKFRAPRQIEVDIARFEELKNTLKAHAERVNTPWKQTGLTPHEILVGATRHREALGVSPEPLHPTGYDGGNCDPTAQRRTADHVDAYRKVYEALAQQLGADVPLQAHPWFGVRNSDLQYFDVERVAEALGAWQTDLLMALQKREALAHALDCDPVGLATGGVALQELLNQLSSIPTLSGNELLDRLPVLHGEMRERVQAYLDLFESVQAQFEGLARHVGPDILNDLSVVDRLLTSNEKLKALVGHDVALGRLAEALARLSAILDQLEDLTEPLIGVSVGLGPEVARHLNTSEAGLREFKAIVELVSSLNVSYWKLREDAFDNDELDEILPRLRTDLVELRALRQGLTNTYALTELPEADALVDLGNRVSAGGLFKWFKGDWRDARRTLMSHAANKQVSLSALMANLTDAAQFARGMEVFENSSGYKPALGSLWKGLETDEDAAEALRSWYKRVRECYGVGFGAKVAVGNAVLNFDANLGKALRSLADRNIQRQIDDILDDLSSLREVFAPVKALRDVHHHLGGADGVLPSLMTQVKAEIQACGTLVADDTLAMSELADRIERLSALKQDLDAWASTDIDNALFDGRLGLSPGAGVDNAEGVGSLRNTLTMAKCVDEVLSIEPVKSYILENPTASAFETLATHAHALSGVVAALEKTFAAFRDLVQLDKKAWLNQSGDDLDAIRQRNDRALEEREMLPNWLDYVRVREQVQGLGLSPLADAVEQGLIGIEQVETAHKAGVYDLLAREILREDAHLARFSGHAQEAIQAQFKQYDDKLKSLQCEQIAWKIDQVAVPSGTVGARASDLTELALLERECAKKSRHVPLRQLVQRAGNALAAIKPCFMMGPMSVAQYLAPGQIQFDLVIMDEASQIKPQDALGALARGSQLVIVGDPKQLPPTSFFDRMVDDGEEDPTALEESESILDATLPMFAARRLRWHYRSQHEALIAFSNHSFYDSDLVLFPSPHKGTRDYGIHYVRVERGCFVNRKNIEEARVISEAVRDHFRQRPKESLGVVAMSAEQRLHIERAIETLAKDDPTFQTWLERDAGCDEPLFIKNLENVQGDERDVIFISMTYGPQEVGGQVYQRFGPINSDLGWRRLNVLFTRSKKRMHIFSSMRPDDIVVGPTSKRGVKALQNFLRYCETGILHQVERDTGRGPDSDFEVSVTHALRDAGFECVPQVGVSGFFIDVAVVDPGDPGRFLMGIECDGATYHSAKSARDRDRLRQAILERLGWRIRRIWSTDWFKNPRAELGPILRELNELKSEPVADLNPVEFEVLEQEGPELASETGHEVPVEAEFVVSEGGLRENLSRFDREVIQKAFPDTPANKRLLRPAMLEALVEFTPTSKFEFLEVIPQYLRQATDPREGAFLEQVFELINASMANA